MLQARFQHDDPDLADATVHAHARRLSRELDHLLGLEPGEKNGRHARRDLRRRARQAAGVPDTARHALRAGHDVQPTSNAIERALRPSVIFRKVTHGFRSAWGATAYADVCAIVATGKLAGHSALAAIRAAINGHAAA